VAQAVEIALLLLVQRLLAAQEAIEDLDGLIEIRFRAERTNRERDD